MSRKRLQVIGLLAALVLGSFFIFSSARPAQAIPVFDVEAFVQSIKEYLEKLKEIGWKKAATTALDKAASNFINKLAQDTGEYLATGGKGQSSLQRRESFGAILRKDTEAALGDFVQDLSEESGLDKLGLNLCNPTAQLKASISLQLLDAGNPQPLGQEGCNIREIQENWRRFAQTAGTIDYSITQGSQFALGGGAVYGAPRAGQCVSGKGQCGFIDQVTSESGICAANTSSDQSLRTYCSSDADCPSNSGCIIFLKECTEDSDCLSGFGLSCLKTLGSGSSCYTDDECSTDEKCVGATAGSSGVPWLDITKDFSTAETLKFLNELASPQQSDLGAYTLLSTKEKELREAKEKYKTLDLATCNSYKDVGSKITDDYVHRTCDEIKQLQEKTAPPSSAEEKQALDSKGDNAFWLNAAKIFGRSLVSGLLKKYIKAGSFSLAQIGQRTDVNQVRENIVQQLRGGFSSPLDALTVTNNLAEAKRPSLDKVDNYDYVSLFSQCPDDRNIVELDNCTIDDNFASAIREQKTIAEALADGSLRGDLPLISNLNTSLNSDPFCVRNGYCHSNIVRLRKYRVLPIGWEIAASLSPIDDPVTLQEAIDCFENSGACPLDPAANVYFHLIDPNWVLKAPETQCKAQVFGPKLLSIEVSERQRYCADGVSCLAEDDAGSCVGGYGYCTKEKNIWRFEGDQCPKEYASCSIFTRTSDQKRFTYLANTIDSCDSSQDGCQWYSKGQENIGTQSQPNIVWNPNDRIYFNKNIEKCEADQAGCSEYVSLATAGVNLLPNGDFDYFKENLTTNLADPNWLNDGLEDTFDGWQGSADAFTTRDNAYYGTVGLRMAGNTGRIATNVISGIAADKTFVLSWFAKAASTCETDVAISSATTPAQSTTVTYTTEWKRFELTKTFDVNTLDTLVNISFSSDCTVPSTEVFIDGVKFELNNRSSAFSQYAESGKIYLKSQNQCTKEDVGCDVYTATESGFKVPGRIDSEDLCPAECVGYQNYLELPSLYDYLEQQPIIPPTRSADFIASTAAACPAAEVNCEEFTNQEEVAQGGEGKYYFSYIRQCVEDALGSTYYTLEGSDTAGYQVRTWRLLESDTGPAGNRAPCTNVDVDTAGCVDGAMTPATCTAADLATNLDCREFFDINGNAHYRLQSKVIVSSSECQAFRRTTTGTTFYALGSESRSCAPQNNNCREYRGNQSGNLRNLFTDYFEQGTIEPWDATLSSLSTEAVSTGGHSIVNRNPSNALQTTLTRTGRSYTIAAGREVYMDFWMKNDGPVTVTVRLDATRAFTPLVMQVASDWQQYRIGPVYVDTTLTAQPSIQLSSAANPVYFDNIIFKESQTNIYVIKETWRTPASCDQPVTGAMLGCQAYTNSSGTNYNLRSFSKLCSNDVVGCQAFIDTHNSTNPFQRIYNIDDPSEVIVPEDSISYLVYNEKNRCFSQSKGCSALGQPQLNLDLPEEHPQYISGYSVQTLLNDPDTYESTLCTDAGLFCEEYSDTQGQTVYFKNPRDRVCVFKENVNVSGELITGWFQKKSIDSGGTLGCSDNGVLPFTDSDYELLSNLDYSYDRWVGECSTQYDRCTEFKDPLDTQGDNALQDPEFGIVATNYTNDPWKAYEFQGNWGNMSRNIIGNGGAADSFEKVPALGYAVSRVSPKGLAEIYQQVDSELIDQTAIYSFSVDVNIQAMPVDPYPALVRSYLRCYWDSPEEVDYCYRNNAHQYAFPCQSTGTKAEKDADCATRVGSGAVCDVHDWYYCNQKGACSNNGTQCGRNADCGAGNTCVFPNPRVRTNIGCNTDAECAVAPGLGTNYYCELGDGNYNRTSLGRDQAVDFDSRADISKINEWQTLHRSVDLGYEGRQKELLYCYFYLYQFRSQPNANLTNLNEDGGNAGADLDSDCTDGLDDREGDCRQTFCVNPTDIYSRNPAARPYDGVNPAISYCNLSQNGNNQCTVGPWTQCGGTSEVWWKNPSFKVSKSYYYVNNDEIDSQSCNGQVGKKDGCLLFLDTSNRQSKTYDSFLTYSKSAANNGGLVTPVSCAVGDTNCSNDTNKIIKVRRDRQCTEWLSCRSATEVFDPATNSFRQICDQIGTCEEYVAGSDILNCAKWATPSRQRLEYGFYVNRPIDFDAADYTGYSIYNSFQVGTLELVDVSNNGLRPAGPDGRNPDYRLVRVVDSCDSTLAYEQGCGPADPLNPSERLGRCFATNKCVVGIDGSRFSRESDYVISRTTRAWAEKDSPFPYSVVESDAGDSRKIKFGFQESNVCDTKTASCEDRYYKFRYGTTGNTTKYFSADVQLSGGAIPACLCEGGQRDNLECLTKDISGLKACSNDANRACDGNSDCALGGICADLPDGKLSTEERCPDNGSPQYLRRSESFLNWPGYCLEPDNRANINASQTQRACLNWLPVDNSPVGYDFFNQNREAGYSYKVPAYYCLEVGLFEQRAPVYLGCQCKCDANKIPAEERPYYYAQETRYHCNGGCGGWHEPNHCYAYPIGGSGLYSITGIPGWGVTEKPDASCQAIAQAVDERGENAAMTNLFWSDYNGGAGYAIGQQPIGASPFPAPLGYKIGQDDTPFGSAVPTGLGFVTDKLTIKNPREIPRAGSPYACSSDSAACALFDSASRSAFAVQGWTKNPPFPGNEDYTVGLRRLKEIYKKIFNVYKWGQGDTCSYFICARQDDPDGTGTSSYFGGVECDPSETNACNLAPSSCTPISSRCVNSVFNSGTAGNLLYGTCGTPLPGFVTEQSPRKRYMSSQTFADATSCAAADLDPGTPNANCSSFGFACADDGTGRYRCFSGDFLGNDCKIPYNADGSLKAAYLTCNQPNPGLPGTCYYDDPSDALAAENTGVACSNVGDCAANDDGDYTNTVGTLHEINKTSFCADTFSEGAHDFGAGSFCTGAPFSIGQSAIGNPLAYIFDENPVHCENSASYTNALGYTLTGSAICTSTGQCMPSYQVRDSGGTLMCERQPEQGYLPLCNPSIEDCTGIDANLILDDSAQPLDMTASSTPSFSPYIVPVICDASGVNCRQSVALPQFNVPDGPTDASNNNGFSVNNKLGTDPTPQNNIITGFQNTLASLKFYMAADKNHIPVRYIELDWGDGLAQTRVGYYKNHLEQCGDPTAFGPITAAQSLLEYAGTDQACREAFRNYLHVYAYDVNFTCGTCSNNAARACGRAEDCLVRGSLNSPQPVCNRGVETAACYRPRVMVQDNWGWCTNSVYGITGLGCKDPQVVNSGGVPSPVSRIDGYVSFPGYIKVYKDPRP